MTEYASFARDTRQRVARSTIDADQRTGETDAEKFLVSYRNRVYDVRDFLRYHPGGRRVFAYLRDRSLDKAFEQNPHSNGAFHLLEDFVVDAREKYQEYEGLIDWNLPIIRQVGELGDRYWEWVNLPVNREIRFFQSDLLEALTISPWYLVPIVWIPLIGYSLLSGYQTITDYPIGSVLVESLISYALGILLWSILEYTLHRKLFHLKPPATSKALITLHFLLHGCHHKAPFDDRRLVFPPVVGLVVAKFLVYIYQALFPRTMIYFMIAGTITGYTVYDLIHYYLHHGAPKIGTYLYNMKRNHNYHHFLHNDLGFGISSKLWDYVFGTKICLRRLTKPIEW